MAGAKVCECSMALHAGHGLTYRNVVPVASIDRMHELNIGHSIVSRAMRVGMERAVREMKAAMTGDSFVDCRNVYPPERMQALGFGYECFGR